MSEPAFDEILRRLATAEVNFVVVGGLAVNAWGVVRGTKDVDVVVADDPENPWPAANRWRSKPSWGAWTWSKD